MDRYRTSAKVANEIEKVTFFETKVVTRWHMQFWDSDDRVVNVWVNGRGRLKFLKQYERGPAEFAHNVENMLYKLGSNFKINKSW